MSAPETSGPRGVTPQLVFGLLIIAAGVLLTLDNMRVLDAGTYLRWWPVALIALGLAKLWQSRDGCGGGVAGAIFTGVGAWLLLESLDLIRIDIEHAWPILLVILGATLVWRGLRGRPAAPAHDSTATITAVAILGAVNRGSNSRTFRGGEITAIMGGCEIDLRQASIDGEAVFDVFAMWGGIDLRVPEDWTVISRVTPLLGGVEDRTRPPQGATTHRLVLRGFAIMGGIEVKN
jgi:hypothetical protein